MRTSIELDEVFRRKLAHAVGAHGHCGRFFIGGKVGRFAVAGPARGRENDRLDLVRDAIFEDVDCSQHVDVGIKHGPLEARPHVQLGRKM